MRHIACASGANIDLLIVPSSTADATAVPRSSAEPPPFRHAFSVPPFPLSGKSTPQRLLLWSQSGEGWYGWEKTDERRSTFSTKLGKAERAKVGCCPSLHQSIRSKLNNKIICGYGEIGRRAGFRFLWVTPCGFESLYPHHISRLP